MNNLIADKLAESYINDIDFLNKTAGCITEIKKPVKKDVWATIPGASIVYTKEIESGILTCDRTEFYKDLVPNTNDIGVLYFEDLGSRQIKKNKRYTTWKCELRGVCWMNMKKIGFDNSPEELSGHVIQSTPSHFVQDNYLLGGSIKVSQMYPKRPSPFDKYSYKEEITQHLIHHFDYFSFKIEVGLIISNTCHIKIILNPATC